MSISPLSLSMQVTLCCTFPLFVPFPFHFLLLFYFYRPQTKLREGNVFTGVCLSTGGGGWHVSSDDHQVSLAGWLVWYPKSHDLPTRVVIIFYLFFKQCRSCFAFARVNPNKAVRFNPRNLPIRSICSDCMSFKWQDFVSALSSPIDLEKVTTIFFFFRYGDILTLLQWATLQKSSFPTDNG